MKPGTRVEWACGVAECTRQRHLGVVSTIWYERAVELGLTSERQRPIERPVAVVFDDRPGVIQFHSADELRQVCHARGEVCDG